MPNILADEKVLPELLQDDVNGERIADESRYYLRIPETAQIVKDKLGQIKLKLGSPGVAERTAKIILQTAEKFLSKNKE